MGKLTKRSVDALECPTKGQAFLWDRETRGFGVRALPSGLKSYVLQYRAPTGRSRRINIGRHGVLTVEQARNIAREKLVAVSKGTDPADVNKASRVARSVAEICDWFTENAESGRILGRRRRPIKPSTLAMDRSRIEQHIKPLIGKKQVRSLSLGDIEGMQADIAAGKSARKRLEHPANNLNRRVPI
ncbi:integrase arm-type DNA-binding domain-containing protein [Aurantimonas sp. E1-2-R+4]|uniref:Arm DNA-binding domain-containing protein n=1 Tax=Aurantimonas sp. E1-2-R+4 TaxID=3113714 RepID=UPI002F92E9BD